MVSKNHKNSPEFVPMFKTPETMAKYSGIGENTLRTLIHDKKIDYIQVGNRKLLTDQALWDWYENNKIRAEEGVI